MDYLSDAVKNGLTAFQVFDTLDAALPLLPSLDHLLTVHDAMPAGQFVRASAGSRYRASGLLDGAVAANTLRIDHDPVTGANLGALIEESRTNYLLNSFAPVTQSVALAAGTYTLSVLGTGSAALSGGPTGTALSGSPVSFTLGSTTTVTVTVSGMLAAFQVELGAFATSVIVTGTTSASRVADVLSAPVTADWFNSTEGTLFLDTFVPFGLNVAGSSGLLSLSDETASPTNQISLYYAANGSVRLQVKSGSNTAEAATAALGLPSGTNLRLAATYTAAALTLSLNGATPVAATYANPATALSRFRVGALSQGQNQLSGRVRRAAYLPKAVSGTLLQRISA